MPSTGPQSSPVENESGWSHRYGLPNWMRNNFERLNTSTNFEEYACSPPETDSGFIPDFDAKMVEPQIPTTKTKAVLKTSRSAPTLCELERSAQQRELSKALKEAAQQNFLTNSAALAVPHILGCHSASTSTETTPTNTPQGSPMITRKSMRKEGDTAPPCNSKQWYYPGVFADKGAETMPVLKENPDCSIPSAVAKKERPNKMSLAAKGYKKFMVSNFDLNAVSPTSW